MGRTVRGAACLCIVTVIVVGSFPGCGVLGGSRSGGGGSGNPPGSPLTFAVTAAPKHSSFVGSVFDAVTALPVGAASVSVSGGPTLTTDSSGSFQATTPTGRATVSVTASGYLTWSSDIGVTSALSRLDFRLYPTATPAPVSAGMETQLPAGMGSVTFPAGAYTSDTTASVTWVDRTHLDATGSRLIFLDAQSALQVVLGILDVEVASEPSQPVLVRLPVPSGATSVALFARDSQGQWSNAIPAASVANGFGTFSVTHFTQYALVTGTSGCYPVLASGGATITKSDGTQQPVSVGDCLPAGTMVNASSELILAAPYAAEVIAYTGNGPLTVNLDADQTPSLTCGGSACEVQGHSVSPTSTEQNWINAHPKHLMIRTKTWAIGVRGTIYGFSAQPCSSSDQSAVISLEVEEGDVNLQRSSGEVDVTAGHETVGCDGCANPNQPYCDCDPIACAAQGERCLPPPCSTFPNYAGMETNVANLNRGCFPKGSVCCAPSVDLDAAALPPIDWGGKPYGVCPVDTVCQCGRVPYGRPPGSGLEQGWGCPPRGFPSLCDWSAPNGPTVVACATPTVSGPKAAGIMCPGNGGRCYDFGTPSWCCADLENDPYNCGACGHTCGRTCVGGSCQ